LALRNLKLVLAYDGTLFNGWQVQPDKPTVQGTLATAIERLTGENVFPQGSGRTDAGVHALAQVASFVTGSTIPLTNFAKALNDLLPSAIRIINIEEVPAEFHPRHSAKFKTYQYRIFRGEVCSPFLANYVYHYPFPLDEVTMMKAAEIVIGEHDFTSFAAVDPESRTEDRGATADSVEHAKHGNVRTIYSSTWTRNQAANELVYTVRGNGFLHHMVRNLVGTFLLLGKRSRGNEKFDEVLEDIGRGDMRTILQQKNRSAAGPTALASGLYLVSVEY
jgi:tRNA pseudouridine38-40 synthase